MGVKRCNVAGCLSSKNRIEDTGVTFHQLPAKRPTREIWITAARVPDDANVKVCSRHFREADFKLVNTKYFLIKGCYPTIFPWGVYTHEKPAAAAKPTTMAEAPLSNPSTDPLAGAVQPTPTAADTEPPKASVARVNRESLAAKRHSIAATAVVVEAIKTEPVDDIETAAAAAAAAPKPLRKSTESTPAVATVKKETETGKKVDPVPGTKVSAMDFQNVWHKATILEVDTVERELLIHFEEDNQQK